MRRKSHVQFCDSDGNSDATRFNRCCFVLKLCEVQVGQTQKFGGAKRSEQETTEAKT